MKDTKKEKKIILQYDDDYSEGNQYSYIYFKDNLKKVEVGEAKKQVSYDGFGSEEAKKERIELIVDFDQNNKMVGIEVISDRDIIPDELKK